MTWGHVRKLIKYSVIIGLVIVLSGLLAFNLLLNSADSDFKLDTTDRLSTSEQEGIQSETSQTTNGQFNLLLVGGDQEQNGSKRSDTVMVANIDLDSEKVSILSIPRDTRVKFPDGKYHKINAAYAYGGLQLLQRTVSDFLGVEIDNHLEVDYNGFIDVVNLFDGVEVNIEKKLAYRDQAAGLDIDLAAGEQVLNGTDALDYVRFRNDNLGDIGRIDRQQKFLQAVTKELLSYKTILKVPVLLNEVRNTVKTNISTTNFISLISLLKDFSLEKMAMDTLPGHGDYINGVSYWLVEEPELNSVLNSLNFNSKNRGGNSVNGA
ncbi:MAG: LCP family protein [Bacillota bacterium]